MEWGKAGDRGDRERPFRRRWQDLKEKAVDVTRGQWSGNGLGPEDASQAPPPEQSSPGPLAPMSGPARAGQSRCNEARGTCLPESRVTASLHSRCRSARRTLCRYCLVRRPSGSTWRSAPPQGGTILPRGNRAVKRLDSQTLQTKQAPFSFVYGVPKLHRRGT